MHETIHMNYSEEIINTIKSNTELPPLMGEPKAITLNDLGKMLLCCADKGQSEKVYELMSRGAPFSTDWLGNTALHLAAKSNHAPTCEILLRAGISKNARTKVDRTPLHYGAYYNHKDIVLLLLANNCDVDSLDMLKMTALHWAVQKGHVAIVDLLLKHKADQNIVSKFNKTPLIIANETGNDEIINLLISHSNKIVEKEQQDATDTLMFELQNEADAIKQLELSPPEPMDQDIIEHFPTPSQSPPSNLMPSKLTDAKININNNNNIIHKRMTTMNTTSTPAGTTSTNIIHSTNVLTLTNTTSNSNNDNNNNNSDNNNNNKSKSNNNKNINNNNNNNNNYNNNNCNINNDNDNIKYNNDYDDDDNNINNGSLLSTLKTESHNIKRNYQTQPKTPTTSSATGTTSAVLQMLKDQHGISMLPIDENDNLLNTAIKSGRRVVVSDGGKLLLNDPKYKKLLELNTSTTPQNVQQQHVQVKQQLPTVMSSTPSAVTTTSSPKLLNNTISNNYNNNLLKRVFPKSYPSKVVKILSSNEFKQLCAEKGTTIKNLSTNARITTNGGQFKVQVSNSNVLSQILPQDKKTTDTKTLHAYSTTKKFINNNNLIKLQHALTTNTDIKSQNINVNGETQQHVFKLMNNNVISASALPNKPNTINVALKRLPGSNSSAPSTIAITPIRTISTATLASTVLTSATSTTPTTTRSITISPESLSATNYINNLQRNQQQQQQQQQPSPMPSHEMERQLVELKKIVGEVVKQLDISLKECADLRIRVEQLEQDKIQYTMT